MPARIALAVLAVVFAVSLSAVAAEKPFSGKYWVYFGTYTGGKSSSKGIYRSEFDVATGKLSEPELAAEMGSPSFVAIAPNGKALYAVGEASTGGPKKNEGTVRSFSLDPATGKLAKLNDQFTGGPGPCHVSTDPSGKLVVTANYGGGSSAVYTTKPDGSFDERTAVFQHTGSSVNPARQKEPHAHCGFFDKTGKFAFVADLGLDKILVYKVDSATGQAEAANPAFIKLPDGTGPRHLHIAESNDVLFVCGELDCTVHVVRMNPAEGKYEVVQSLSTLRPGEMVTPKDSTAEVRIHPSGKFVYVSNRGHDTIAAFKWDGNKLTPVGHATGDIQIPRNFNIDPTGKWMLVANQAGNSVVVFAIDPETGLPKSTSEKIAVDGPVCVRFLAKP